ncbi:hypothetical protein MMC12_001627 [Toensbergia leucococca]|nr:hypothetical protein [Toensbergia leucococca]
MHSGSPRLHGIDHGNSPYLAAIQEPDEDDEYTIPALQKKETKKNQITKSALCVDAFLGEWLSPDYFDSITPPPGSLMMVASAKADLLRQGDYSDSTWGSASLGNFPGGWGSGSLAFGGPTAIDDHGPLSNLAALTQALPPRNRASSHNSTAVASGSKSNPKAMSRLETIGIAERGGYVPPTPTYAVSPLAPIPPGLVAHARDACVNVEYQWDSMRPPQEWGDGGDYGEEWSSMHKRFRRGFQKMITWYRRNDMQEKASKNHGRASVPQNKTEEDDDGTDTVLILVTHGAGCNALIGAITNQPVLLDVGMASLTMAVRKPPLTQASTTSAPKSPPLYRRHSSNDLRTSDEYEVKLVASTEHLRSNTQPIAVPHAPPQQQSTPSSPSPHFSSFRHRYGSPKISPAISQIDGAFSLDEPDAARPKSSSGFDDTPPVVFTNITRSSTGLWSKPAAKSASVEPPKEDFRKTAELAALALNNAPNRLLEDRANGAPENKINGTKDSNSNGNVHDNANGTSQSKPAGEDSEETAPPINGSLGCIPDQRGLWGAPPPVPDVVGAGERPPGVKRRWTLDQQR